LTATVTEAQRARWGPVGGDNPEGVNEGICDLAEEILGQLLDELREFGRADTGYGYGSGLIVEFADVTTPAEFAAKLSARLARIVGDEAVAMTHAEILERETELARLADGWPAPQARMYAAGRKPGQETAK
jgi:hypothetical protein